MTATDPLDAEGEGCDCAELCSMGPTCPGGTLAGLPGSGCSRASLTTGWTSFEKMTRRQAIDTCYALEAMRDRANNALAAAHAEVERHGPCTCITAGPDIQGPDEMCPKHGRPYHEVVGYLDRTEEQIHADDGFISQVVDLTGEVSDLRLERDAIREGIAAEVLAEVDQMLGQDWSELGRYALQSARSRIARSLSTAKEATKHEV